MYLNPSDSIELGRIIASRGIKPGFPGVDRSLVWSGSLALELPLSVFSSVSRI